VLFLVSFFSFVLFDNITILGQYFSGIFVKSRKLSGGQSARWAVAPVEFALTPTRKAIPFAGVHLIHCRHDLLAKGRPPYDLLMKYYLII
jgi:hypothetical protein